MTSPNGADPSQTNAEAIASGVSATGALVVSLFESKTKAGSAGGEGASKRFPPSVQDKAADESREENGQAHCAHCGVPTADPRTAPKAGEAKSNTDHIVPVSKGGDNTIDNAQNTCQTCNKSAQDNALPKTTGADKLKPPHP